MALRLSGEEFSIVQGLDAHGWLREVQANDASPGLEITQSGSGAGLRLAAGHMVVAQGEAIELHNAADEGTNYERLRAYWGGNVAYLATEKGGSGASRNMALYPVGGTLQVLDGSGNVKATFNANGLRVGDATAPTVSLEAANGLTVAAGDIDMSGAGASAVFKHASFQLANATTVSGAEVRNAAGSARADFRCVDLMVDSDIFLIANGATIGNYANDDFYVSLLARDNGVGKVEVARLESDAEPRFCHTRPVNLLGADASELTISSGAVTITAGVHMVDTEGDAASDDLDTVNGGRTGDILVIVPANAARTVVAKHGTGNLNLSSGADFTMDEDDDFLVLLLIGSTWQEISRSENHA